MIMQTAQQGYILADKTVIYTHNGEQCEQPVGEEGTQWWVEFCDKWEGVHLVEFATLYYTQEQIDRLEEVNRHNIVGYMEECNDYVLNGNIPNILPFENIKIQHENKKLSDALDVLILDLLEV